MTNELTHWGQAADPKQLALIQQQDSLPQIRHVEKLSKVFGLPGMEDGRFYFSNQETAKSIPLGKCYTNPVDGKARRSLICILGNWRYTAMRLVGGQINGVSHDPDAPLFKSILAQSKGERDKNNIAMVGLEWLLYVPPTEIEQSHPEAANYPNGFCGVYFFKGTAAKYAPNPNQYVPGTPIKLINLLVEWKNNRWWSPQEKRTLTADSPEIKDWMEAGIPLLNDAAAMVAAYKNDSVEEGPKSDNMPT